MGSSQERSVRFSIDPSSSTPSADSWALVTHRISYGFSPPGAAALLLPSPPVFPHPLPPYLSCLLFQELVPCSVGKFGAWKVMCCDSFPLSACLNRAPYGVLPSCPVFLTTTPCANMRLLHDLISCL